MRLRYYLINKNARQSFNAFTTFCKKVYREDYFKILRYCIKKDDKVINEKFGEMFAEEHLRFFEEAKRAIEERYRILVGMVTQDGFYMADMGIIGIYSLDNLINFLRANPKFIVEDENGLRVSITDLKKIAKIKKVHLHYRDTMNADMNKRYKKVIQLLTEMRNEVESDYQAERSSSTRASELLRLNNTLNSAIETLKKGDF